MTYCKIEEIFPCGPDRPNGTKLQIHVRNLAQDPCVATLRYYNFRWKHTDAGTNSTMGAWYGGLTGWATMNCSLFFISAEILLGIIHELELAKMVFSLLTAPSIWPHTLTLRVQLWEGGHNSSTNLAVGFWVWY